MNNHIQVLEDNDWIYDCVGHWCSLLLLAAKPHQKSCIIIDVFIYRLYVSYRPLNSATRSSKLSISYYIDIIVNFGDSCDHITLIALNNRSRYHQIRIHQSDQKTLANFTPSRIIIITVMPFGTHTTPTFNTTMIQFLRDDWIILFE